MVFHPPLICRLGIDQLPLVVRLVVFCTVIVALLVGTTIVLTNLRYHYELNRLLNRGAGAKSISVTPPKLPYAVPGLGHALWFLDPFMQRTGKFYRELLEVVPRSAGACTIQLGPEATHILFDPLATDTLIKMKHLNRDKFDEQVVTTINGATTEDLRRYYGDKGEMTIDTKGNPVPVRSLQHLQLAEFLLKGDAVRELTIDFVHFWQTCMDEFDAKQKSTHGESQEVRVALWFRDIMFKSSLNALWGTKILEVYPEFEEDYWTFDQYILHFFFVPKIFIRSKILIRDRCQAGLLRWFNQMLEETGGVPEDPRGPVRWEPRYGSRLGRERQNFFKERKLSAKASVGTTLGMIFALESNAIPTAQWMLMHILDPNADPNVRKDIIAEVDACVLPDNTLDANKLCGMPLLQSAFSETMRLYTDVLVARNLPHDIVLPTTGGQAELRFAKGSTIFAPSWLGHRNEETWENASTWQADRFTIPDTNSHIPGARKYSLTGTAGKYFPFGGGSTMCPGRVFAKQEVIVGVAMVLQRYDIEVLRFVEDDGSPRAGFPSLKPALTGTAGLAMTGDAVVRMRRR